MALNDLKITVSKGAKTHTFLLKADKYANFLAGFLKKHPVPLDERTNAKGTAYVNADGDGNPKPLHTDLEWLLEWLRREGSGAARAGLHQTAKATVADPAPKT